MEETTSSPNKNEIMQHSRSRRIDAGGPWSYGGIYLGGAVVVDG